jgi:hypothetical protein
VVSSCAVAGERAGQVPALLVAPALVTTGAVRVGTMCCTTSGRWCWNLLPLLLRMPQR